MKIKHFILAVFCLLFAIYALAFLQMDLTDNVGKIAVGNHLLISEEQAVSIAKNEWGFQNLTVTIDQQDARLTFGLLPGQGYILPMFEWVIHIRGVTPNRLLAGGNMYIEAFTGKVLFVQTYC